MYFIENYTTIHQETFKRLLKARDPHKGAYVNSSNELYLISAFLARANTYFYHIF
jgi:hypothetical protein